MIDQPFSLTTWRLIKTRPANGAWNMAVDEAILESVQAGKSLATLRLFEWSPPCISLGYAQPFSDIDEGQLTILGWDVVRRITGGRAILHTDELTYSVIGPVDEPRLEGGVLESYRRLSGALLNALANLGVKANAFPKLSNTDHNNQEQKPVCFEVPSNYEITVDGKKLIGSAQARKKAVVLQHGTLPLHGDITRIIDVLNYPNCNLQLEAKNRLLTRGTTVESLLNYRISWEQAATAMVRAFEGTLRLSFQETALTPDELSRSRVLENEKYASPSWTERI